MTISKKPIGRWAAHEIGHYLAARRHGVKIEHVSLMHDNYGEFGPHLQSAAGAGESAFIDILLSGWAAEAYFLTNCRERALPMGRFLFNLLRARSGAGWRLVGSMPAESDLGLLAKRRKELAAKYPIRSLLRLAESIRAEQPQFYKLIEALTGRLQYNSTGDTLDTIYHGGEITDSMIADSAIVLTNLININNRRMLQYYKVNKNG